MKSNVCNHLKKIVLLVSNSFIHLCRLNKNNDDRHTHTNMARIHNFNHHHNTINFIQKQSFPVQQQQQNAWWFFFPFRKLRNKKPNCCVITTTTTTITTTTMMMMMMIIDKKKTWSRVCLLYFFSDWISLWINFHKEKKNLVCNDYGKQTHTHTQVERMSITFFFWKFPKNSFFFVFAIIIHKYYKCLKNPFSSTFPHSLFYHQWEICFHFWILFSLFFEIFSFSSISLPVVVVRFNGIFFCCCCCLLFGCVLWLIRVSCFGIFIFFSTDNKNWPWKKNFQFFQWKRKFLGIFFFARKVQINRAYPR